MMTNHIGQRVKRVKNILLASAAAAALAGPLVIGVGHAPAIRAAETAEDVSALAAEAVPPPSSAAQAVPSQASTPQQGAIKRSTEKSLAFDAASIKPNNSVGGRGGLGGGRLQFTPGSVFGRSVAASEIILEAYHLKDYQLSGGQGWLADRFDLEAKAETRANENELRSMLQTLLAERCKLVVHHETKEMLVYALIVAKNGPKLRELKEGDPRPSPPPGTMMFLQQRLPDFVDQISSGPIGQRFIGRPVLDKTGLQGVYLFQLTWGPDEDFMTAVQEQLGLKFESQKAQIGVLVIDHIEKPEAN